MKNNSYLESYKIQIVRKRQCFTGIKSSSKNTF